MGIVFTKGIFAMIGIIEREMIRLAEHCNVKAENGEKYGVIYDRLLQVCPKLHTDQEHKQLSKQFVKDFATEFNHHELRVWFEVNAPITFGDEGLERKYHNLLKIHDAFVNKWLQDHELILTVDVYLFGNQVRDSYRKMGVSFSNSMFDNNTEDTEQLWGIIKTIRDSGYKKELIMPLQKYIKVLLDMSGGFYYNTLDLTDKDVLRELYYTLSEVLHKKDGYKGHNMFHDYDGYGNTIFEISGDKIYEY